MLLGIVQGLAKKVLDAARIGLVRPVLAERFVEDLPKILRVEAMAQVRNEADVLLGGAAPLPGARPGRAEWLSANPEVASNHPHRNA